VPVSVFFLIIGVSFALVYQAASTRDLSAVERIGMTTIAIGGLLLAIPSSILGIEGVGAFLYAAIALLSLGFVLETVGFGVRTYRRRSRTNN